MSSPERSSPPDNGNHDPRFWQNLLEPGERRPIGWIPPEPHESKRRRGRLFGLRTGRHRGRL